MILKKHDLSYKKKLTIRNKPSKLNEFNNKITDMFTLIRTTIKVVYEFMLVRYEI